MSLLLALAAAAPQMVAPPEGVISYPAAFFADRRPGTALDMINRLPGFTLDTGATSLRGYEAAAGNVLIDGRRPASKTDTLDEILKRLPASAVERIDVIRGGAPGIDMQGKSVLANVIRKKGASFRSLLAASNDLLARGRDTGAARAEASGGWGARKWEFGSYIGKGIDDGWGDGPGLHVFADGRPPLRSAVHTEGDQLEGQLTGALESPLLGGVGRINGRWHRDKYKYNEDDLLLPPAAGRDGGFETDRSHETELGLNYLRPLGGRADLELVGLRHPKTLTIDSTAGALSAPQRFQLDRHTAETIGRIVLKARPTARLSLEAGAERALNTLDSDARLTDRGARVDLPAAQVGVREARTEGFVKAVWRPTAAWTVDAGLRLERSHLTSGGDVALAKTLTFAKPRVTAVWAFAHGAQARLRVEREVGQLNFDDFVAAANLGGASGVTAGNPDLEPEQAWVVEAAVEQRFWGDGVITVTGRRYRISNAIDRGPVTSAAGVFDQPENIGGGRKAELQLELTLPLDRLGVPRGQLKGDLTKRWSRVTDPTTHERREISALHPLDWNAYFTQDLPRWNAVWGVDVYGAWRRTYYRFNLVEDQKLNTYVRPYAEWRPRPDLNIRLELPNVTSRAYRITDRTYAGLRRPGAAPEVDDRDLHVGRMYYLRVRKTFGG